MGFDDFIKIFGGHHGRGGNQGGHHDGHDSHRHGNGGHNYGYLQPSAPHAPAPEAEQRPCPKCAELVQAGFKFCSSCGASLEAAACKGCGAKLPQTAVFCPGCGAKALG